MAAKLGGFITRVLADVASGSFESNAPQRAQQLRAVLSSLGPSFVKTGQALSGALWGACVLGKGPVYWERGLCIGKGACVSGKGPVYRGSCCLTKRQLAKGMPQGRMLARPLCRAAGGLPACPHGCSPSRPASQAELACPEGLCWVQTACALSFCQLAARPDLLPKPYLDALSELQDRLPSFPSSIAFEVGAGQGSVRVCISIACLERAAAPLLLVHSL